MDNNNYYPEMSAITGNMRSVFSNDIIDEFLEKVFPENQVNVYEMDDDIINPAPKYGNIHHNFKVIEYKSKQYVIEVKSFKGFENKDVFMCWISGNEEIKMTYGKTESIKLLFEILTS
jgi:hypothetical protein